MSQVKIGPKFFANELRVYRNWASAFWRENIQNSYDAGADKIDITIADGSCDETKTVVISDNGGGMDRKVLEEVYFTLGETTKDGTDSVGGFGKARILTCFAQKSYALRTNQLFVTGEGSTYNIEDVESRVRGVRLEIEAFHKGEDLEKTLKAYLKRCHLQGCQVTINGSRWNEWTFKNKLERTLTFANVYTNKSKEAGILVRVNGVHMFQPYTSAPFLVIIEIHREQSREVLQANRDGLIRQYQDELESFLNELAINKQSALREKRNKSIHYEGSGTFKSRKKQKSIHIGGRSVTIEEVMRGVEGTLAIAEGNTEALVPQGRMHDSGFQTEERAERLEVDIFDVYVSDNTQNPAVRKVIESYYPHNWDLLGEKGSRFDKRHGEIRSFRAGIEKYKLLVLWRAACEAMISFLQNELDGPEEISWGVGWSFNDDPKVLASHKVDDNGVNWLLLNPCDLDGKMRLSLSDKRDLVKIISDAAHEVAHICFGDHDERFANLLNSILEEALFAVGDVLKEMKSAKESETARIERISDHNKAIA